nr:CASP-like protein 4A2 [Lolium perenne]
MRHRPPPTAQIPLAFCFPPPVGAAVAPRASFLKRDARPTTMARLRPRTSTARRRLPFPRRIPGFPPPPRGAASLSHGAAAGLHHCCASSRRRSHHPPRARPPPPTPPAAQTAPLLLPAPAGHPPSAPLQPDIP